jgi:hypothetical protein
MDEVLAHSLMVGPGYKKKKGEFSVPVTVGQGKQKDLSV